MSKYIFLFFLFVSINVEASYFDRCFFKLEVVKAEKSHLIVKLSEFLKGDGHLVRGKEKENCLKYLKNNQISKKLVKTQIMEFKPGQIIRATRHYFNGMGPDGLVDSVQWEINPL